LQRENYNHPSSEGTFLVPTLNKHQLISGFRLSAFDLGTSGPPTFSAHGGQVCIFLRVYQSFSDPHVTPGRAVVVGRNRHRRGE